MDFINLYSKKQNITIEDLKKENRKRDFIIIKHVLLYSLNFDFQMHPQEIAHIFNMERTSVIHAANNVIDYLEIKDVKTLRARQVILQCITELSN